MIYVNKINCNIVKVLRKSYVTIFVYAEELDWFHMRKLIFKLIFKYLRNFIYLFMNDDSIFILFFQKLYFFKENIYFCILL